jgi:hypothetical protein
MTKKQYHNATGIFSTQLAIGSFVIGTLLLILHLTVRSFDFIGIGLIYVAIAVIANLIMLFYLIYLCFTQKNHQDYFIIKILILLANIPIALVYLKIVTENI